MKTVQRMFRSLVVLAAMLIPSLGAFAGEPRAEALAAEAEALLDRWDGEATLLEAAEKLLREALLADPASSLALATQARRVLLAGTEDGGIRPSALRSAEGLLNRAAFAPSPHPRAMALRGHLFILMGDIGQVRKFLMPAAARLPGDPWVKLYLAEYHAVIGDRAQEIRYLEEAIAAGLPGKREMRKALDTLMPIYLASGMREKADGIHARTVAMDPANPMIRGDFARRVIEYFVDFDAGARLAREALAMSDYPHARQTLSLALYGRWAQAAKQGSGPDVIEALYREATANDPDGSQIPGCLALHPPLQFVFERLEAKRLRREQMHRC